MLSNLSSSKIAQLALNGLALSLEEIEAVAFERMTVSLDASANIEVKRAREIVENIVASGQTVYGLNTGFGKLSEIKVETKDLKVLQLNLVRSHACGLGRPLSNSEVRAMLLLRSNVLAKGVSGVRLELIQFLLNMLNRGVHPIIPEKGSVGASGDLAPLAHLACTVIGEGEASVQGLRMSSAEALKMVGMHPLQLEAKEGLALLNGTQAMNAVGALAIHRAQRIVRLADLAGAMSLEGLRGTPVAFDPRVHEVRPQFGQREVAKHLISLLASSEIRESHRNNDSRVQDAYCLRCIPQVHGAVRNAIAHARSVMEIESGSATDNPIIFAESSDVISGGNFHGAPLGMVMDYAAIALTDLMSISERRIDRLINPDINEGLPPFLSKSPGVSSGFMIAHVAAAALLNEAKVLAHPASVDSVPTSGGKEDHVSMGMTSALKLRQIVENAELVLAIEIICSCEAIECRLPLKPGARIQLALQCVREHVAPLDRDRSLAPDIEMLAAQIRNGVLDCWLE